MDCKLDLPEGLRGFMQFPSVKNDEVCKAAEILPHKINQLKQGFMLVKKTKGG